MSDAKNIAEKASMQSFLNCYLRETGQGEWLDDRRMKERGQCRVLQEGVKHYLHLSLAKQGIHFYLGVQYKSPTGRHLFNLPIYYQVGEEAAIETDYVTFIALLVKELSYAYGASYSDELLLRVIQSCHNMESYIKQREKDGLELYGEELYFIEAEQALLFGHLTHPTPKSRQGFPEWNQAAYSPELKGEFQLHYFRVHQSVVVENSALPQSATELIKAEVWADQAFEEDTKERYCQQDEYSLIPVHPIQAEWLLNRPKIKDLCQQGVLEYLGPRGRAYQATSSIRTVYHAEANYMLKLSLHVKVTNSLRVNKLKELESGVEVKKLLNTCLGDVKQKFPGFDLICDPAYITVKVDGEEESGFEMILRENVFQGDRGKQVTLVAALVQDALPGHSSRLATIIHRLALEEERSVRQVSLDWFRRYLKISLEPMVWLYLTYGIALEAHQQNSLVQLKGGYPERFYFRDNQGYYYCRSRKALLDELLPGIGEKSQNIFDDQIADERFRYYLMINHMLGVINGFGTEGLINERELLAEVRSTLEAFIPLNREGSTFLTSLLQDKKLPCKANLLTRLFDIDELTSPLEQAVYVQIENPLVTELPSSEQERSYEYTF